MTTIEEILADPNLRSGVLDKLETVMNRISRITARMNGERVPPITGTSTQDAVARTDQMRAYVYARDMNEAGARMGRRACREPLPAAEATSWPVQMTDSAGPQDCVDFYEASRSYAEACRRFLRQK